MSDEQKYKSEENEGYTQRDPIRAVGIGKVPEEYKRNINSYEEKQRRYDRGQIMYDFESKVMLPFLYKILY